jgi:tRNA modification GTPase
MDAGSRIAAKLRVSVLTGQGLDQVKQLLPELVYAAVVTVSPDTPVLTRRRHADGLRAARTEVEAFRLGLEEGLPPEVASTHLRPAETALEEILGVISVEDVLDAVFAEFCVGK